MNDIAIPNILDSMDEVIEQGREPADVEVFACAGGKFEVSDRGVFFSKKQPDDTVTRNWLCSRLDIVAQTRDGRSGDWGRLLQWTDPDGNPHQWAMPVSLLQGDGADVRRELASQGLRIATSRKDRELLAIYLQSWPTSKRARCVKRLGWYGDAYVMPGQTIGEGAEVVVWQGETALEYGYSQSGSVDDWTRHVASLAVGNSRVTFAISCAFAGPLLDIAGMEGGGFHLIGGTSTGKSTSLDAAASTWGKPVDYSRKWAATKNGLEGMASLHNDGLLILDEIKQASAHDVGDAAYLLANGQGKTRAKATGDARNISKWRLLFLSAGEITLTAYMAQVGRKPNAGMEVRLAEIPADAGCGHGAFENIHHFRDSRELSDAIKAATAKYHGTVGIAWLECVAQQRKDWAEALREAIEGFVADVVPEGAAGQVSRVAARFGLVAFAGELATSQRLTGWQRGASIDAAKTCFEAWLTAYGGTGPKESRDALQQVRAFMEQHHASRFESVTSEGAAKVINSAGFYRETATGREYLIHQQVFQREVCSGIDHKVAEAALIAAGWINRASDGRPTHKEYIKHLHQRPRFYVLSPAMWDAEL